MKIHEQLLSARRFRGMTATELARRTGIPNTSISIIEHGRNKPTSATIERMAEALDMQVLIVPKSL